MRSVPVDGEQHRADELGTDLVEKGVEHLQAAATELIAAARAFLDVAEEFVEDPDRIRTVGDSFAEFLTSVSRGARAMAPRDGQDSPAAGVQHIHVG